MKPNPNLDELLSSFMDGELSPRQRTEVQRMATHDPQVARRLQQLQNCRTLYTALPVAKAPGDLLEQIKASLERHTLLQEQPATGGRSLGAWHLAFRRFMAAAAVFVLMGVLGVVIYEIVSPTPWPWGGSPMVADSGGATGNQLAKPTTPVVMVADTGLTGRLELRTAKLAWADTFLDRNIRSNGLSSRVESSIVGNRRVYQITGSRAGVNRLVAQLGGVWQNFDGAALRVDRPEKTAAPVVVEGITPEQTAHIVAQDTTKASVETAASYAIMNRVAKSLPGKDIRTSTQYDPGSLLAAASVPYPRETGPENGARGSRAPLEDEAQVNLTIVLLDSR